MTEFLTSEQKEISKRVVSWARLNEQKIENAINQEFWQKYGMLDPDSYLPLLEGRSLSEIGGVCNAILTLPLPEGFISKNGGAVFIYDKSGKDRLTQRMHSFAESTELDYVLCIATGQFFDKQKWGYPVNYPGDRMRAYNKIASDLVALFPNIAVVHGPRIKIFNKLHLQFT